MFYFNTGRFLKIIRKKQNVTGDVNPIIAHGQKHNEMNKPVHYFGQTQRFQNLLRIIKLNLTICEIAFVPCFRCDFDLQHTKVHYH